jgi:hypothetical protein
MISSSSLREHLCFEHAGALRRETPRAGCALIKRPHLSAVSFLKSDADFLAGTVIAVQPFASSEEAELWGPAKDLSSEPTGAKHGGPPRLSMDAFCFNDLRRFSSMLRERLDSRPAPAFAMNPIEPHPDSSRATPNRFVAAHSCDSTRCTTITLEDSRAADASHAIVSGA